MDEKIIGIVGAYDVQSEDYPKMRECGFTWIRSEIPFPWEDQMFGKLSEKYLSAKERCKKAVRSGLKVMGSTFGVGSFRFDSRDQSSTWRDEIPDFVGKKGSLEYYANLEKAAEFLCKDLQGLVHGVWQCMNEIDNYTFAGAYAGQVVADTARALAKGIVTADPKAKCGINLCRYWDEGLELADLVYREGHCFSYIGDDQYFGSWQGKTVEYWPTVVENLYSRYNLPVLANEWGYSSGGAVQVERPNPEDIPLGWTDVCFAKSWFHEVEGGHTEQVQANYLRRGLEIFAGNSHVMGAFLFCWKDAVRCYHCGLSDCPAECFWGIVDQNGQPKPAYFAVREALELYYK